MENGISCSLRPFNASPKQKLSLANTDSHADLRVPQDSASRKKWQSRFYTSILSVLPFTASSPCSSRFPAAIHKLSPFLSHSSPDNFRNNRRLATCFSVPWLSSPAPSLPLPTAKKSTLALLVYMQLWAQQQLRVLALQLWVEVWQCFRAPQSRAFSQGSSRASSRMAMQ